MPYVKTPWLDNYGDVPKNLEYYQGTMYGAVKCISEKYPDFIAFDFMGKKTTYTQLIDKIDRVAKALIANGIKKGDRITICLPNCPQAVAMFYAANRVGAIANMIHPLSAEKEIEFYLNDSKSVAAITLDQFYRKFEAISSNVSLKKLIITSIKDELNALTKIGYALTQNKKMPKPDWSDSVVEWKSFLKSANNCSCDFEDELQKDEAAVILYSGGTTGTSKGILLSSFNFNALAKQIIATNPMFCPGDKMLAVMPVFHGFGLGVSVHSMLASGGRCVLVPRFTAKSYAKLILKTKCNFIAGVPTLFEALLRQKTMKNADLSCLKGVFCGGDSLSVELKKKFDDFLKNNNSSVKIREGYGTTECVTASCLTPMHLSKEGSIGQPFPDTYYKIVKPSTDNEVEYGQEGEICISGPTVMLGYLDRPDETEKVLKRHSDGLLWVHTGDLGKMDEDGFVYFCQRIKRVIVTNGYNVYPSHLENIFDANGLVQMSCVIGVPDALKMQKVKAFVVLKKGVMPNNETKNIIFEYGKKHIAKYALPYDIEFREELPKTLVGKVDYRKLENNQ